MQSINEIISGTIRDSLDKWTKTLPFTKIYDGNIIAVLGNKKYIVRYNDAERNITTKNDISLSVGDKVHVVYPLGTFVNSYLQEDTLSNSGMISGVKTVDGQDGDVVLSNTYASKTNEHTHSNKTILDGITSTLITNWNIAVTHISDTVKHITSDERTNWDSAYSHSTSTHAPSDAEKNVIIGIQKNGTNLTVGTDRNVNIVVPTTASDINALGAMDNAVSATKAEKDLDENVITSFYGHSLSVDGTTVSLKDANGNTLNSVTISSSTVGSPTIIGTEPETPTDGTIWIED